MLQTHTKKKIWCENFVTKFSGGGRLEIKISIYNRPFVLNFEETKEKYSKLYSKLLVWHSSSYSELIKLQTKQSLQKATSSSNWTTLLPPNPLKTTHHAIKLQFFFFYDISFTKKWVSISESLFSYPIKLST